MKHFYVINLQGYTIRTRSNAMQLNATKQLNFIGLIISITLFLQPLSSNRYFSKSFS